MSNLKPERTVDNQTTDKDVIVPVVGSKVLKECSRDEFLLTLANLSDEERKNANWSIIK